MSPLSPGKYQQFFNLTPISPTTISSIESVAGLPTSVPEPKTANSKTETITATDVNMNTDLPSPSFFAPLFENNPLDDFTNLETWLYNHNLISPTQPTSQPEALTSNFFANLPDPVFDTHVFGKPPTPIVATFADLEIDPLIHFEQGPLGNVQPHLMSWEQGNFEVVQTRPDFPQMQTSYPEPSQALQPQHPYYSQQPALRAPAQLQQNYHQQQPASYDRMLTPILPSRNIQVRTPPTASSVNTPSSIIPPTLKRKKSIDNTLISYPFERPKKPSPSRSFVRTNQKTKGLTTRTGKINHYDPSSDGGYVSLPQPAPWMDKDSGLVFHYNVFGELFAPCAGQKELERVLEEENDGRKPKVTFTAEELTSYLLSRQNPCPPALFLQRTPADSARRYPTTTSSACRFASCPAHGKINVGSYRVAIDERPNQSDPFVVAGYMHLYCLERFVDLPELVKRGVNVVVDERVLKSEPKGKFAPSLGNSAEAATARTFLAALRDEDPIVLHSLFPNGGYPIHTKSSNGAPKPHHNTLTYLMHKLKISKMPASRIRQQADRGMNAGNVLVHMGDLEVAEQAREEGGGVGGGGRFRVLEGWRSEGHVEKIKRGLRRSRKRAGEDEEEVGGRCESEGEEARDEDGDGEEKLRPARPIKRVRRS